MLEDAEVTKALKARARVADRQDEDTTMHERDTAHQQRPEQPSSSGTVRKAESDRGGTETAQTETAKALRFLRY